MKTIPQFRGDFIKSASVTVVAISFLLMPQGCKPKLKPDQAENVENAEPAESDDWSDLVEPTSRPGGSGGGDGPYPLEKTIRNASGQELQGMILAKRGDDILFQRSIDNKEFVVSLHNLNIDDRLDLVQMPDGLEEKIDAIKPPETVVAAKPREARFALGAGVHNHGDYDTAKAASEKSGRPILVIITGTPMMDPGDTDDEAADIAMRKAKRESQGVLRTILTDRGFQQFVNENFEFIHIDYLGKDVISEEDRRTQEQVGGASGIFNYPAAVVLKPNGYELAKFGGFGTKGANPLIEKLENVLKDR